MNKLGGFVVTAVVCGVFGMGCSSSTPADPFGASPDFAAIEGQFQHPTGTFAAGKEGNVFSGYSNAQSGSSSNPLGGAFGGSSGQAFTMRGLHAAGLHSLADATGQSSCNFAGGSTGTCACPNGGDIRYDISGFQAAQQNSGGGAQNIKGTIKFAAEGCKSATDTVDGKMFIYLDGSFTPPAPAGGTDTGTGSGSSSSSASYTEVFDAHMTDVNAQGTTKIDLDYTYANGVATYLISVDDGSVVVSGSWNSTSGGTITIRDKNDTWTCTSADGHTGTCTSASGGAPRPFTIRFESETTSGSPGNRRGGPFRFCPQS